MIEGDLFPFFSTIEAMMFSTELIICLHFCLLDFFVYVYHDTTQIYIFYLNKVINITSWLFDFGKHFFSN